VAARPGTGGGKTLGGFSLHIIGAAPENQLTIDPMAKTVTVNPRTWSWAKNDNGAMGAFVHEKAEAVRLMKVVMQDVSRYAPQADPNRVVPPVPMGITLLCRDLATLVGDLAALDSTDPVAVQKIAARYGKMRDTMATLRTAFTEAEGAFDVAQQLLVQKMGLD
jgi:hypothetical protein